VIYQILTSEDYTGKATWNFKDGQQMSIEIPQIISPEQFKRAQDRMERNTIILRKSSAFLLS
jgi:hypothetical protein